MAYSNDIYFILYIYTLLNVCIYGSGAPRRYVQSSMASCYDTELHRTIDNYSNHSPLATKVTIFPPFFGCTGPHRTLHSPPPRLSRIQSRTRAKTGDNYASDHTVPQAPRPRRHALHRSRGHRARRRPLTADRARGTSAQMSWCLSRPTDGPAQ